MVAELKLNRDGPICSSSKNDTKYFFVAEPKILIFTSSFYCRNWDEGPYQNPILHCPCCCLITKSCLTLCDPMNCSTPGFLVLHYLLEFAQTMSTDSEMPFNHPYMTTGKTSALTIRTFVGKVISLLFNTLSRFVIVFLPRNKCLLISWLQSLSTVILGLKKLNKHGNNIQPWCTPFPIWN